MKRGDRDPSLDALLDLDGQVFVVDHAGQHWVKFAVRQVPVSPERPRGVRYALTLHDANGERLLGFDNAHPVRSSAGPAGRPGSAFDHKHRHRTQRVYGYQDAATLLADFWAEVDAILKERGVSL